MAQRGDFMGHSFPTIKFSYSGNLDKTRNFLRSLQQKRFLDKLDKYGRMGVEALREATPKRTGTTANSWDYIIEDTGDSVTITWTNSNENRSIPIALLIQYGHGTGTGGWVAGVDYINPALKPIFDEIAKSAWEEVTKA
jgi:hypothetical protein